MRTNKIFTATLINLLLFLSLVAFAQQAANDSLLRLLQTNIPDSSRSLILDRLGLSLMTSKPLIALQYAQQGLEIAQKAKFQKGVSRNMNRIGAIMRVTGNFPKSLKMHLDALKIAEEINDLDGLVRIYNQLGLFYSSQKDHKKAIETYFVGVRIARKIHDKNLEQILISNIGADYAFLDNLDSARFYTQSAYLLAKKQNKSNINVHLMNLANVNARAKNYLVALNYYRESLPYSQLINDNTVLGQTYFEMADVFKKINQHDSTFIYAKKSLKIAVETNHISIIYGSNNLLSELYSKIDVEKSYQYFKDATAAKDNMFNQEKAKQIENISFAENLKKQELIDAEKESKNRQWSIALLSIIGFIFLISIILYRNNRIQNKANRLLSKQKVEIELQRSKAENALNELESTQMQLVQKEKLASLGEITAGIAHEIQNPLNFVNNFSELSIELADELKEEFDKINIPTEKKEYLEELLHDLTKNQERIHGHGKRASSIVSNMLEHSRSSDGEAQITDINKLAEEYLSLSYHGMRAKNKSFNADYQLVVDENLPMVKVNQQDIGRVLLNLFNNAFYAASQSDNPTIRVITKRENDYLIIEVIDNGKGISKDILPKIFQPFFTTKPTGEGTGLGLSLSYDIITKGNNGKIEVLSEEGKGATFVVKLPINN
jgi:two-component system, NtrC family, sensor kinase